MLGNEVIYQIFVRNYSQEGTFKSVEKDLERIKDLGVDIVYLMPIHEIGELHRKGTYGSPYAIKDYFSISPDLGTKEDFISLVNKTHELGMKIILDMVFNHTSPDNVLVKEHPEYYFYKNGKLGNRVGDWSDIVDLDVNREDTQEYLLSVLSYWSSLGVDGYRFDVASMIPLDFFKKARKTLQRSTIFVGESIGYDFANYLRSQGDSPTPDDEMFPTFDCLYNYSWYHDFERYLLNQKDLDSLIKALNEDEKLLAGKGIRLNTLENHDRERLFSIIGAHNLKEVISFFSYIKGPMFIYNGQEYGLEHKPELFEKDPIIWKKNKKILSLYKEAIANKKKQTNNYKIYQKFSKINKSTIEVAKYLNDELIDKQQFEL